MLNKMGIKECKSASEFNLQDELITQKIQGEKENEKASTEKKQVGEDKIWADESIKMVE